MARIYNNNYDYDNDNDNNNYHQSHQNSRGYNMPRSNGGIAVLAIVCLIILFFLSDLSGVRGGMDSTIKNNQASTDIITVPITAPVESLVVNTINEVKYVTADYLNMREQPGIDSQVRFILARGTKVALLGESHQDLNGFIWLKVRVETLEGNYVGWVSQQYVEYMM